MAMTIDADTCSGCGACEAECPNGAIKMKGAAYAITAGKCTECAGLSDNPRCADACPSDSISPA